MIPIPYYISDELKAHILNQCPTAESGWEFANQDEDTLTGDFFGKMRTQWHTNKDYEWRFHYNKVRGRGRNAMEKTIGADGIITLHYRDRITDQDFYKSLVFQAKKINNPINKDQWKKMNAFFPGGNMIVCYSPQGYNCYINNNTTNKLSLCKIIAEDFLQCKIGIMGLYYDHKDNKFIRPNNVPTKGTVDHELMIEVFKNP
ncbi:hypothetical protein [Edaphocola flava]|uniref:hypothetical protein n=1 Tax=Edaphocola flava TaxID=2499629 RepID=UPI00100A9528|nr:hypothetical protein [Edaphocola flava]